MRIKAFLFLLFCFMALTACVSFPVSAVNNRGNNHEDEKVFLVLVDRLSLNDLLAYAGPVLKDLMKEGSLAVVNTKTGDNRSASGYLSMGTGARAAAGPDQLAGLSLTADEQIEGYPAEDIYERYLGLTPGGEVFNISMPLIRRKNEPLDYKVVPGLLGESLAREGKNVAVFGNADRDMPSRPAVMVAMDKEGAVPHGNVSREMLIDDPMAPFGIRLDGSAMAEAVSDYIDDVALLVVDWGDPARIDEINKQFAGERRRELMEQTFQELDLLLGSFHGLTGPSNLFILAVPSPPLEHTGTGKQLTPLIVAGGKFSDGLVVSPTTRRPGLVGNLDLPATVLEHLQVKERPPSMGGAPMYTVAHAESAGFLSSMTERVARIYEQRPALLRGYLTLLTLVILAGGVCLVFSFFLRFSKIITVLLEASMVFPVALLILSLFAGFPPDFFCLTVVIVLAATTAILGLLSFIKLLPEGRLWFWTILGLSTSLFVFTDIFLGGELQKFSFMGYDPVAGARYFGMGNEYMGVAIGATVLGTSGLLELSERGGNKLKQQKNNIIMLFIPLIIIYYLAGIIIMSSPHYGANVGGTLAATVAFGVAAAGIVRMTTGFVCRPVYITGAFLLLVFLLWGFYQYAGTTQHWHLQSFLNQWMAGDFESVGNVIIRKLNTNLRLLRYSVWAYVLIAFLGLLILLFYYPAGRLKKLKGEYRFLFTGIVAIVSGSVAALLLNDSGVVAAATALLFAVPPLLIYYLGEKDAKDL